MIYLKKIYIWVASSWAWQFLLTWIIPAIRFGGKPITDAQIQELSSVIQKGDCILLKDPKKLSHILIGGTWSHAAICTSFLDDQYPVFGEMGHAGFQEVNIKKLVGYSTKIAVIRPKDADFTYMKLMGEEARRIGLLSIGYDFIFSLGEKSLYCSELVYLADYHKLYQANLDDLAGLGHPYISPDGLYKAKGAKIVFEIG